MMATTNGTPDAWYCEGCESLQGNCEKVLGVYLCLRCQQAVKEDIARDREEVTAELSGQDIQEAVALGAQGAVLLTDAERRLLAMTGEGLKGWIN